MNRKEIAVKFLSLAASVDARDAYDRYVHPEFIHHNPWFKADRESLLTAMEDNARQFPNKVFEVLRVLEDGDLVAVHGKVRLDPKDPVIALIHIFRFEEGQIIESWEAAQPEVDDSPNELGLF